MNDSNKSIPWDKIENQPEKEHKIRGRDIIEFRSTIEAQQGALDERNRKIKQLETEKASVESALNAERARAADLERRLSTLEHDYKNKVAKASSTEAEVQRLQEKIAGLEGHGKEIESERDRAKQELEAMGRQIENFKRDIGDLQARVIAIEAERAEKGELSARLQQEKEQLEKEVADLQQQRDAALEQYVELEKTIKKPKALDQSDLATARACMTCKQYIILTEGDYNSVKAIRLFDATHRGHMVSTVTYSEVKNGYTSKTDEFLEKSAKL
ncbi:MAG: hypothetical protein Q6373_015010 [Candidatus Sigynarchaeota archaeon]